MTRRIQGEGKVGEGREEGMEQYTIPHPCIHTHIQHIDSVDGVLYVVCVCAPRPSTQAHTPHRDTHKKGDESPGVTDEHPELGGGGR
jgi:hypothetical protein